MGLPYNYVSYSDQLSVESVVIVDTDLVAVVVGEVRHVVQVGLRPRPGALRADGTRLALLLLAPRDAAVRSS